MRHEAIKEIKEEITKIKEEIIDGLDQAEARLQEQIAEGNKQTMAALQRLRKHCLPPLSATVKQHGQSPPPLPRRQRPSAARAPPQGAPGGSGQLGAPRARPQPLEGAATPPRPLELAACKGAVAAASACR